MEKPSLPWPWPLFAIAVMVGVAAAYHYYELYSLLAEPVAIVQG